MDYGTTVRILYTFLDPPLPSRPLRLKLLGREWKKYGKRGESEGEREREREGEEERRGGRKRVSNIIN